MKTEAKRKRLFRDRSPSIGQRPGSLTFVGQKRMEEPTVSVIDYGPDGFEEYVIEDLARLTELAVSDSVTWINVNGVHDDNLVAAIGQKFQIPDLILEDVMNTTQRAHVEDLEHALYIVIRMLGSEPGAQGVSVEQVSIIMGERWLITFQEWDGDVFDPIRERIRGGTGRIRRRRTDYLAHSLLDAIIDRYFVLLDQIGYRVEELEEEVLSKPADDFESRLYKMRRELVTLRRSIWPSRELCSNLLRIESPLIAKQTLSFYRDAYEHAVQIIDIVDSLKDVTSSIGESYRAYVGSRMNQVMQVLTIIATIFIPLTFIAGIYGMNFEYMPELGYRWGYFVALGAMALLGVGLAVFFKARKWF